MPPVQCSKCRRRNWHTAGTREASGRKAQSAVTALLTQEFVSAASPFPACEVVTPAKRPPMPMPRPYAPRGCRECGAIGGHQKWGSVLIWIWALLVVVCLSGFIHARRSPRTPRTEFKIVSITERDSWFSLSDRVRKRVSVFNESVQDRVSAFVLHFAQFSEISESSALPFDSDAEFVALRACGRQRILSRVGRRIAVFEGILEHFIVPQFKEGAGLGYPGGRTPVIFKLDDGEKWLPHSHLLFDVLVDTVRPNRLNHYPRPLGVNKRFSALLCAFSSLSGLPRLPAYKSASQTSDDNQPPVRVSPPYLGPFEGCVPGRRVAFGFSAVISGLGLALFSIRRMKGWLLLLSWLWIWIGILIALTGHYPCPNEPGSEWPNQIGIHSRQVACHSGGVSLWISN